jgi:hypothetical protein
MAEHRQPETFQGVTHGRAIVRLPYTALAAVAATSKVFTFAELRSARGYSEIPANALILDSQVIRHADFAGGAISAVVVDVGDAGAPNELQAAVDVFTGAKATADINMSTPALPISEPLAYAAQVTITSTGADLSELTAGVCELAISYRSFTTVAQS